MQWYRADLHVHTPGSADFHDSDVSFIHILRKAEQTGLDVMAFTDHNTVAGYSAMMREVEKLNFLERLGRAHADELRILGEYRRLLDKVLVLPGFEFTATFGFHILGIFSPSTPLRQLEHLLLTLNVPPHVLDSGETEVGASADVLTAYRVINEAGGICIAAHANSSHGVAMLGLDFGGQTRMAYTQDRHLHALEVTDLGRRGRNTTQRFFDGTKPEYPRRMRCIQGSDAHSLNSIIDKSGKVARFGVGERVTEVLLPERSFEALLEMFRSTDFSRSRPYSSSRKPYDYIQAAREEGPSLVQSFHESMARRGGRLYNIIADVCAFANTNGGTIYVGLSPDKNKAPAGIGNVQESINILGKEINQLITPALDVEIDSQETQGKNILRIQVPFGEDRPYAIEEYKIYVRDEAETSLAVRDEIVNLVKQGAVFRDTPALEVAAPVPVVAAPVENPAPTAEAPTPQTVTPPRAGVEIVGVEQRNDKSYYVMRDLRNGNIVKNVTRASARRLWHYAIKEHESHPIEADKIHWQGEVGLVKRYQRGNDVRYDLAQRDGSSIRIYYGVTDAGMHTPWDVFLAPDDEEA